jgi:hypothetical protein
MFLKCVCTCVPFLLVLGLGNFIYCVSFFMNLNSKNPKKGSSMNVNEMQIVTEL